MTSVEELKLIERRISRKLGSQARALREAMNRSQTDMEYYTGMIRNAISRFEYGHTTPTIPTLLRIADGLDCDLRIEFVPRRKPPPNS